MTTKNTLARISLYRITEQGLYKKLDKNPVFGDLSIFLDDLIAWVSVEGKTLKETCTYASMKDTDIQKTFCYDIKKSETTGNFLLITWNKLSTGKNSIPSISGSAKVGEASISNEEFDKDAIPGFPTYFWIMPKEKKMATISFDYHFNGRQDLHRYLKDFMGKWSKYVECSLSEDDEEERNIEYWRDPNKPEEKYKQLFSRFDSRLLKNPGKVEYLLKNFDKIRKVHQHNKITIKDLMSVRTTKVFGGLFSIPLPTTNDTNIKFRFETEIQFQNQEDLKKIITEWQKQNPDSLTKWDDLGFSLQGDPQHILWLSSSFANDTFECSIARDKDQIFKSIDLVKWLDSITAKILVLDKKSSESNG